ncbi:hypothetical protein Tco_0650149 [Tanacetum coccineum]
MLKRTTLRIIQNGNFYYEVEDSETKLMKETLYELLEDDQKKQLGKNNEAKMTLYNALSRKEYERVFMCKTAKEKFSIANEESIDSGFTRFNAIVTSLTSLDPDYSSKNHVRKFLRALPLKWRAKDLRPPEKVKSLALKAKVTREQTSNDSDSQGGSDEDIDEEEEAEAFNLLARNFRKFFRKGNQFGRNNRFGNGANRKPKENKAFVRGAWSDSEVGDEHQNNATCLMAIDSQDVVSKPSSSNIDLNSIDLQKENEELLRFNKDFAKTFEKLLNEKRSFESKNSNLLSKIKDLEFKVNKFVDDKEVIEPCQKYVELTQEVDSLKSNVLKLQDEALNFSKFKESSIVLDDLLNCQKLSQDKEGLGFSKNDKTTSASKLLLKRSLLPERLRLWIVFSAKHSNINCEKIRFYSRYKLWAVGTCRIRAPKGSRSCGDVAKNTSEVMLLAHGSPSWSKGEHVQWGRRKAKQEDAYDREKHAIKEAKRNSIHGRSKAM